MTIKLASAATSSMYAIPAADWTAINQRVGSVLAIAPAKDVISQTLSQYPALLDSSQQWTQSTFQGLITHARELNGYAGSAMSNFSQLHAALEGVKQGGGAVPPGVQQQTASVLQQLAQDTAPLAAASGALATSMRAFLTDNQVVDGEIARFQAVLGSFWAPVGATIAALEQAAGRVTGGWSAITDDLNNVLAAPIDVTLPFLESLEIQAALASWQAVQAETGGFASLAAGQEQYWTKPF